MSVIPRTRDGLLTFFRLRAESWSAEAASIGLSPSQAAEVAEALQAAEQTQRLAEEARLAADAAIEAAQRAAQTLRRAGGRAINTIRAFAEATDDPEVYPRASIPAVRDRTPRPAPPPARNVRAQSRCDGVVIVSWEGSVANGTTYSVWRRALGADGTNMTGPAEYIGTVGDTMIVDEAVPPRILGAMYTVQAIRGRKQSPISAAGTLRFTRAVETGRKRAAA